MANKKNKKGKQNPEQKNVSPNENKKQIEKPIEDNKQIEKDETKQNIEVVDFPVEKNEDKKDALQQAEEKEEAMEEFKESLSPEKEKLLKKQEKEAKKAAKKNQKEAEKKKLQEEKISKKNDKNSKAVVKASEKEETDNKKGSKKQPGRNQYAAVMTTGQFVKAFVLMLIPGVNIICILIWALGGSKNPNKVHFTRACIIFFLIEILVTAMLAGGVYIYANEHEAEYLQKANNYTNGLIEYMDIDSYKKLNRLREIPDFLIDKNEMKKTKKEPVPETRVIENPVEIKSYDDFVNLYVQSMSEKTKDSVVVETTGSQTKKKEAKKLEDLEDPIAKKIEEKQDEKKKAKDKVKESIEEKSKDPETLDDILKKYNVNPKKPGLVYIIIDKEDDENCLIAFDPTGTIQKVPTIRMDNQIIYVGGVN